MTRSSRSKLAALGVAGLGGRQGEQAAQALLVGSWGGHGSHTHRAVGGGQVAPLPAASERVPVRSDWQGQVGHCDGLGWPALALGPQGGPEALAGPPQPLRVPMIAREGLTGPSQRPGHLRLSGTPSPWPSVL